METTQQGFLCIYFFPLNILPGYRVSVSVIHLFRSFTLVKLFIYDIGRRVMTPAREHKTHIKYILGNLHQPISYIHPICIRILIPPSTFPLNYDFHFQIQRSQTNAHFLYHLWVFVCSCYCFCFMTVCYSVVLGRCLCPTQTLSSRAMHICFCTAMNTATL